MSLVRFDKISKSFAGRPVLDSVDLRVETGERIGLIGRNGTGKSTILRLITGELLPDGGSIDRMKKARFAQLAQIHRVSDKASIHEIVLSVFEDLLALERDLSVLEARMSAGEEEAIPLYAEVQEAFTHRGGYEFRTKIKQVLQGLGFRPEEFELPFDALSGGQRTRLMLSLVLLEEADLLLLDEPENHLDLEAREWLESYLCGCQPSVLLISHDRRMLNAVATRIVELDRGNLRSYPGNFDAFHAAQALRMEQDQAAFARQQEFIRKEEAWINRFRYKNTKARQVQSRIKRLEKIERVEAPMESGQTAGFRLGQVARSGESVVEARDLSMAYGSQRLYTSLSFQMSRGERIGIVGPNGSGKTTLLRHLAGRLPEASGEVVLGHKVSPGFYDQHHDAMNVANDVFTEVQGAKPDWNPQQIRTFLGRFLFMGDDVFKSIAALSGGELSRVALAKLILSEANLLLLDEPTNHLDIPSREALEEALSGYNGAMVLVSHDRTLIDRLVDKLILVQDGKVTVHLGNYSHYRSTMTQSGAPTLATPSDGTPSSKEVLSIRRDRQKSRKTNPQQRQRDDREDRQRKRRLDQIEGDIEAMEELVGAFELRFGTFDPTDYEAIQKLNEEYQGLKSDLQALYSEWEECAD